MSNILEDTQFIMKKYKIKANKSLGQNFLINQNVVDKIVESSQITKNDLVIEIGPGLGTLTKELLEKAGKVICIELDKKMIKILTDRFSLYENFEVIHEDVLRIHLNKIIKEEKEKNEFQSAKIVANLPYYITTPIIMKVIEDDLPVNKVVIMVQKEVGDRLKASPGTRDYGSFTVFLDYYFEVHKLLDVSRNVFLPKPNVDSIVVEFVRKKDRLTLIDEKFFFQFVRDCFKQKRKNLRNNLKQYDLEILEQLFRSYGFCLQDRAEQIPLEVYVSIANDYVGKREKE